MSKNCKLFIEEFTEAEHNGISAIWDVFWDSDFESNLDLILDLKIAIENRYAFWFKVNRTERTRRNSTIFETYKILRDTIKEAEIDIISDMIR